MTGKKFIGILLIFSLIFTTLGNLTFAESNERYFVVTAYYSPLPNQNHYLKGNYEDELRLNGMGIRGASGKGVFAGMLAAPKNYAFGTKIELEGLGIGSVEDRGGAIVNAGNRGYKNDRIDVWMGYGDEGLRRALYWGKRTVKGKIISRNSKVNLNINNVPSPSWATKGLKKIPNIFNLGIGKGSNISEVKKLQEFLTEVNLYNGKIDGVYNNTVIDLIYNFQFENDIVKSPISLGAGYWGTKTRNMFLKKYLNGEFDKTNEKLVDELIKVEKDVNQIEEVEVDNNIEIFNKAVTSKEEITKLQKILTELGLYNGELTGNYKDLIDPIYDYQISKGIVTSVYTPGAGSYGPKTRTSLKETYKSYSSKIEEERLEKLKKEEEKKQEELRKKQLEEKFKRLDELSLKKAEEKISNIGNPKFGEISPQVRELQKLLSVLGYFNYKDTAIFGKITKQSLIAFQLDKKIIKSKDDIAGGIFGPKTKEILKQNIKDKYLADMAEKENLVVIKKEEKIEEIKEEFVVVDNMIIVGQF